MSTTIKKVEIGEVAFDDGYLPELTAGAYTIKLEQTIQIAGAPAYGKTQKFLVKGPRFRIPQEDIQAQYPPDQSSGDYTTHLPHIVFTKKTLPWERTIRPSSDGNKKTPWMALVVFSEDELKGGDSDTHVHTSTVEGALGLNDDEELNKRILLPDIKKESLEAEMIDKKGPCKYIEITPETFNKVMPRLDELEYLSHIRTVNMSDKAVSKVQDKGRFSVVCGSRFSVFKKDEAKKNIVHLVSLEGLGTWLEGAYQAELPEKLKEYETVRLISLAQWSYTSKAIDSNGLKELLQELIKDGGQDNENLNLRLPIKEFNDEGKAADTVRERLERGFVPVAYHLITGENSFAWYRGCLSPEKTPALPKEQIPFFSSSRAMIYDEHAGLFDHSYAIAWQAGRALALGDKEFCFKLLHFTRNSHRKIDQLMDYNNSAFLTDLRGKYSELKQAQLVEKKFAEVVNGTLGTQIATIKEEKQEEVDIERGGTEFVGSERTKEKLEKFISTKEVFQALKEEIKHELQPIVEKLSRYYLLYDVPFSHLLADPRMLPNPSLRFFYVDINWLESLVDGALSISIHSSRDSAWYKVVKKLIIELVHEKARLIRGNILPDAKTEMTNTTGPLSISGLLLRSPLVSGWKGLAINAHKNNARLPVYRMDLIDKDVLLILFSGIPDKLTFNEPTKA